MQLELWMVMIIETMILFVVYFNTVKYKKVLKGNFFKYIGI